MATPPPGPHPERDRADVTPAGADLPVRHVGLPDLPPAVANRLRFDVAAPRRLRSERLPEQVRDELRDLWDGIVADVYDEVAGLRRSRALSRATVERALRRVAGRLLQAERVVIVAGVHHPMPVRRGWTHVAAAGVGGAGAAAAEEVAAFGTMGTATTVAIVSAVVGEVFETYVAASARTAQYREAQRSPDAALVITDLAEAAGYGDSAGRRATTHLAHDAAAWLGDQVVRRTASRFARGLVPVVGVGVGAGMSALGVHKVNKLALRPPAPDEVVRLANDVVADPDAYARDLDRLTRLAGDAGPGAPGDESDEVPGANGGGGPPGR